MAVGFHWLSRAQGDVAGVQQACVVAEVEKALGQRFGFFPVREAGLDHLVGGPPMDQSHVPSATMFAARAGGVLDAKVRFAKSTVPSTVWATPDSSQRTNCLYSADKL